MYEYEYLMRVKGSRLQSKSFFYNVPGSGLATCLRAGSRFPGPTVREAWLARCVSLLSRTLSRDGRGVDGHTALLLGRHRLHGRGRVARHRLHGRGRVAWLTPVSWLSAVRLRRIRRVHGLLHRRRSEIRVAGSPRIIAPRE